MVGVAHAQAVHGIRRVAILDFDVHHGNGDAQIAYADRTRLYVSSHEVREARCGERCEVRQSGGAWANTNRRARTHHHVLGIAVIPTRADGASVAATALRCHSTQTRAKGPAGRASTITS